MAALKILIPLTGIKVFAGLPVKLHPQQNFYCNELTFAKTRLKLAP